MEDCHFEDTDASLEAGAMSLFESTVTIRRSNFTNFTKGALVGTALYGLIIDDCDFWNGEANFGSGVLCLRCDDVYI